MKTDTALIPTEHPHVVRSPGVKGGQPIIAGTGITVRHVAALYRMGDTVEEIREAHPDLSLAQVHDAISYYLDHTKEISELIERNRLRNVMREHDLVYVLGRGLMTRERLATLPESESREHYTADTLPADWDMAE